MQDKITIADAPDCLNTNDKAMWVLGYEAAIDARGQCLHQIQEPSPVLEAPKLDEAWKARMLDGHPLLRDKDGIGFHPALPDFDESTKCADFFAALGIELKGGRAENEMDSDAYEAMTGNGLTDANDNYNAWTPMRPEGEGWNLVAVFDTEDGPACWWMRDMPFVPQRSEGYRERVDNAAVEVLSMNMKAKLAGQRAKGYRGWNNDCTQQRLSDLLRECVEKGDPVDVANFCAFLLSRGETIAPRAAPVAVAVPALSEEALKRLFDGMHAQHADRTALFSPFNWFTAGATMAEAALAATPAAMERTCGVCGADEAFTGTCGGGRVNPTALCFEGAVATAIPAAAAQVVLPEPFALYDGEKWYANEEAAICSCADMAKLQKVFTEQQLRALLATATGLPAQPFQQRVQPWMMACFGREISADTRERNHRFLEEALELVQCLGCTGSEAHQLVDYVYGRPWGEPAQEAGGVMVTLAALCLANCLDMHAAGDTELARIWTMVEAIRAKQAAKPKHSPLPMHAPQAQADAQDAVAFKAAIEKLPRYTYGFKSDDWGMGSHLQSYQDPEGKFLNREEVIAAIAAAKGE